MPQTKERTVSTAQATYRLLPQILGTGGTSVVRLGERVGDNKKFALKFFKEDVNDLKAAKEEYELSKKLGFHPNLVNTVDFQTNVKYPIHPDDGGGFQDVLGVMVSDYCPNGTLIDVLTSEKVAAGDLHLDEKLATHVMKQLLTALAHVHGPGTSTAHCDLKWEQVLFDEDFNVKLADFGSGAPLKSKRYNWCSTQSYWSPEQCDDEGDWTSVQVDKADIFAAGVMLHIAYCTKPPFAKADSRPYNEGGDWFYSTLSQPDGAGVGRFFEVMTGYGICLPQSVKKVFEAMTQYEQDDRPSAANLLTMSPFKEHALTAQEYTSGMVKFFRMAYPGGTAPVKGFEGYQDDMNGASQHNKRLFRGAENDAPKPRPIAASDLVDTPTRASLRMGDSVPVQHASKIAVKIASCLRGADGAVTFKEASPFVADAVWSKAFTPAPKKHKKRNVIAKFGKGAAEAMSGLFLWNHGHGKNAKQPLRVRVRLQRVEEGRQTQLVVILDHLAGAPAHFKQVCEAVKMDLESPDLTHESDNGSAGDRFVTTAKAKYKLLPEVLGVGGTSIVRLGERQSDKKTFALKFFKDAEAATLEDARNEYRTAQILGEHPHLVNTVDFAEDVEYPLHEKDGGGTATVQAMLVTDHCPNGTVIDLLTKLNAASGGEVKLPEKCASTVMKQLLEALKHIHSKKVAHCDLKYEQCLLDKDFNLKLLDFGSAAIDFSRRREWCSTQAYWSPEQHDWGCGDWMDVLPDRADLFAAGSMMHIAYTSAPPFGAANESDWYWMALSEQQNTPELFYKYMGQNGLKFPEGARNVFQRLCDFEQLDRVTAAEALDDAFLIETTKDFSASAHAAAMTKLHEMAYPQAELDITDPEGTEDYQNASVQNQHLFRGSDAATHNPPDMPSVRDSGSMRTLLFAAMSGDKVAGLAQNEFKALLQQVDAMGAYAASHTDEPYVVDIEWPQNKAEEAKGAKKATPIAAGSAAASKEEDGASGLVRRSWSATDSKAEGAKRVRLKKVKNTGEGPEVPPGLTLKLTVQEGPSKEALKVVCSFGRVAKGRDSRLALRLRRMAGSSAAFDGAVQQIVRTIKARAAKPAVVVDLNAAAEAADHLGRDTMTMTMPPVPPPTSNPILRTNSSRARDGDVDALGHGMHLGFVGASPLIDAKGKAVAHLDIQQELTRVKRVVHESNVAVKWAARMGSGTKGHLETLLARGMCILHVSAHGTSKGELLFEDGSRAGMVQRYPSQHFATLLKNKGSKKPRLLVLMNCFSQTVAKALANDIDHIICVDERYPILDAAVSVFSKCLYQEIFNGSAVINAFENAVDAVRTQDTDTVMLQAASRFVLIDKHSPRHRAFVFPPIRALRDGEAAEPDRLLHNVRDNTKCGAGYPAHVRSFGGRDEEMFRLLRTFTEMKRSFVLLHGPRGIGKTALATMLCRYMYEHSLCDHAFSIGPGESANLDTREPEEMFKSLGAGLGMPDLKSANDEQFIEWKKTHSNSLVIIDNCETFFSFRPFIKFLESMLQTPKMRVLLIGRKPMRELQEVLKSVYMSLVPVGPLSPLDAAALFQKLAPRELTYEEMGPMASHMKTTQENLNSFVRSPVMNLFPNRNPDRIRRGALNMPETPKDVQSLLENWEKDFARADTDNSGVIEKAEIKVFLTMLGYSQTLIAQVFGHRTEISKEQFRMILKEWGPSVELARAIDDSMKEEEAKAQNTNTYPLESLSTRDVLMLMQYNGLSQFCRVFRDNSVDGSLLAMVDCAEELAEIGVNTKLHRKKLFHLVRNWKESTQMVTREELLEAEKACGSSLVNDSARVHDDPKTCLAEFIRVNLARSAFELMRRLNGIFAGYLCKSSLQFREQHWRRKDLYADMAGTCSEMANLDSHYAVETTLFVFGRWFAYKNLTMSCMSIFMDENCPVHIYPSLLSTVLFAFTGEGMDLKTMPGTEGHPKWNLGAVPSGIFQVMSYEQIEIGEAMLVDTEKSSSVGGIGKRCVTFNEFKAKFKKDPGFRQVFKRLIATCDLLHSAESVRFYCQDAKGKKMYLKKEYCGRVAWLHNSLCTLVKQLDHNLVLKPQSLSDDNQQELVDTVDVLIREQEMRDLMKGFQRKLMCKSIFTKWLPEDAKFDEDCKEVTESSKCLVGDCGAHVRVAKSRNWQLTAVEGRRTSSFGSAHCKRECKAEIPKHAPSSLRKLATSPASMHTT